MDIRFVTAGGGDVVAVMATDGGELLAAGKALDTASSGRIAKAMKAANFKGGVGQVTDILAPDGVDFARVLVIGVGKPDAADGLAVERWAGHAVKRVLTSGAETPATLNFLPEAHIVLLEAKDLHGSYEEVWVRLREIYGPGHMPRTVNMISGPSRTADIEQQLVMGAHGPRRLHVMIVKD